MAGLARAIQGVQLALSEIAALDFTATEGVSKAAAASDELFEGQLIREAEDTEVSLFRPTRDNGDAAAGDFEAVVLSEQTGWQIGRRQAPLRSSAPLVAPTASGPGDAAVARGHLLAAQRLSKTLCAPCTPCSRPPDRACGSPLPRFAERIVALQVQLSNAEDSIKVLQSGRAAVCILRHSLRPLTTLEAGQDNAAEHYRRPPNPERAVGNPRVDRCTGRKVRRGESLGPSEADPASQRRVARSIASTPKPEPANARPGLRRRPTSRLRRTRGCLRQRATWASLPRLDLRCA